MIIKDFFKLKSIKRLKYLLILFFLSYSFFCYSQGFNHTWLIGYDVGLFDTNVTSTKARLNFTTNSVTIIPETRRMPFNATQGNISDAYGNFLMSSNGCWIANANNDTMMNGDSLNPGSFASTWCDNISGLPFSHANIMLPYPGDSSKFILFHQTGNDNLINDMATELFYTVIDMNLDSGLGGVVLKNQIALQDTLSQGIAACKHANGRDWWIIVTKDSSDLIYKLLLTPTGISSITTQSMMLPLAYYVSGQPTFSPDGKKFAYSSLSGTLGAAIHKVRLFDFDRCTGMFSDSHIINVSDTHVGLGLAFSPNSNYLYASSTYHIFQIDINTLFVDTVATNDGYYSPYPPFLDTFWLMYLAANGKIYLSSGNGVIDFHFINYPDSAGTLCDVQQHALHSPCYYFRSNVNHPNYYLGCDTTGSCTPCLVGVEEPNKHDFRFRIYPNPLTENYLHIGYLLPQNKKGLFEMYDITGKIVFKYNLPQWSNEQDFILPKLAGGIYNCIISSDNYRASKKIAVINE